MTRFKL